MEKFYKWLAHRLPRRLVFFCAVRVGAETTTGKFGNTIVPEITLITCLKRWEELS